jgi:DNA polymerase zeta
MSTMSLEVHVNTRGKLVPNPEEDEVQCIFWSIKSDEHLAQGTQFPDSTQSGIIVVSEDGVLAQKIRGQVSAEVLEETSELGVMVRMVEIVRTHDPDILTGYEVHGSSWGYLIERARFKYDYNLCDEFSRMKSQSHGRFGKEADRWGFNTTSTIRVTGRHMINIWRAMRGELNLLQYTMENVAWHLLHRRIPHYSWRTLTDWFRNGRQRDLGKVLSYYLGRTRVDIEILETNELIPRTSEQARVLGVDFFSVFSRGSQFKVESIMFRIAKPENFILVSPNKKQVGSQNALECLPLVMEPQSAFYNSPLLVLDFQSLYPSVMIAYNICYSTFLGRIVNWRGTNKMGFTEYKRRQGLLRLLKDHINITPNGMMYTKPDIRKSLLAKMLTEILETRVMIKSGMKQDRDDKVLQQLLNNRQLALKLLANVTYGYTSASYSGRMPCAEIADSIVQTARETLERAIAFIHSVDRWGAEVVYGDTDSLFIYLKGRTRDQAFDIGTEIAKEITDMNPRPIKLKFEKVYHPCVLLAKKRYVGYKYESRDQVVPEFDAKGIETVRRDGTPAEQKIEEKALKLLFETADLSQVKSYFQAQCDKIMRGAVSIQDFCFAKEVRLGTYSDKAPPPPGALISTKRMLEDARAEPQYGERVPYVVITGAPGARLIDRCVAPEDLLNSSHCTLDAEYYISKNLIPPLERIFNLVGANVRQWYDEMPKVQRIRRIDASSLAAKKTLESYLKSASCVVCEVKMKGEGTVCSRCRRDASLSMVKLQTRLNTEERKLAEVAKVCQTCAAFAPMDDVPCDSKDCPVFYTRAKQTTRLRTERGCLEPVIKQLAELGIGHQALDW